MDRTLLNLAQLTKRPGEKLQIDTKTDYPIGQAEEPEVLTFLLEQLKAKDFIELSHNTSFPSKK